MKIRDLPLADRLNYSVIPITIPPLSVPKRKQAAIIQLSSLYPVSLDEKHIRIYRNGNRKNSWLCVITPLPDKDKNLRSSTLFVMRKCRSYSGNAAFVTERFTEIFEFENGELVSCTASSSEAVTEIKTVFHEDSTAFKKSDILKTESKKAKIKKVLLASASCITFLILSWLATSIYTKNKLEVMKERERIEKENLRKITEQKKNKARAEKLKEDYEKRIGQAPLNAYDSLSVLYSCTGKRTRIESMSIEGNEFSIDLHSPDGADILARFEQNHAVESIRMSRSAHEHGSEFVTYSGTLRRHALTVDESLSDDEKAVVYEEAIKKLSESEKPNEESLSAYIQKMRSLIKKTACTEEYMQLSEANKEILIECMLKGSASAMFSFLKDSAAILDFRSVRIRSAGSRSTVSMVVKVDTHILYDDKDKSFLPENASAPEPNYADINRSFYKSPVAVPARTVQVTKTIGTTAPAKTVQKTLRKTTGLEYVGSGGSAKSGRFIFFKDKNSGELHKLPLKQDGSGDWCRELTFSSYEVHLKGVVYEVRK